MCIRAPSSPSTMRHPRLPVIVLFGFLVQMSLADCPGLCECKWKNGKESVICLNANLSVIPAHLEAGTQVLDLTGNNIVTVKHEEFSRAGLVHLQKVYIAKCRLKSLERYAFKDIKNLVELDLSYNVLNSIPSHTFDSVPELRELKLSGNPIVKIPDNAFLHLPNLFRLEMSSCRISVIETKAFVGLERSLEWLKLDKNKLTDVEASSFTILESLHGLELVGNPWNCSCLLRPLKDWMSTQNVPFDIPPVCNSPKRLYQKSWDKLDLDEFACVPEIFAYDSNAHGIEGKNITMTCRIAGIPKPNVKWLVKNKVIANLSGSPFASGKKLYMVHLTNNSSDLTIFSADLQDAGTYVCSAENKAGKAEASVTLAVSKKPPESSFTQKLFVASVITGIAFAVVCCLVGVCACTSKKAKVLKWRARDCRREDNYEKIEMSQKVVENVNGDVNRDEGGVKKNGEYRVVPGADTDQEEEEESTLEVTTPGTSTGKKWAGNEAEEKRWNSPEHLLDQEDLHIPRRTLQESRDNIKRIFSSTCGTFNHRHPGAATSTPLPARRPPDPPWAPPAPRQVPDVVDTSPAASLRTMSSRAHSESGSVADINELFCTLPRKRDLARYRSSDSQSPLLPDSRYGSSGGESSASASGLHRNRVNRMSSSSVSLAQAHRDEPTATPLLDVAALEARAAPAHSYDYHAQQLEKFLEEYRMLQKQLTKMKETCDSLCQEKGQQRPEGNSPASSSSKASTLHPAGTPNSGKSIEESVDFRNFESELTRYLLAKSSSPKSFNESVFPN